MRKEDRDEIVKRFWTVLTRHDQELLVRCYVEAERPEEIWSNLDISMQEFCARREQANALLTFGMTLESAAEAGTTAAPAVVREIANSGARPRQKRAVKEIDWTQICNQVRKDDPAAAEQLYERLQQDLRFYLQAQIERAGVEDIIQETVFVVFSAIAADKVRKPEKLPFFARTVARRFAIAEIRARAGLAKNMVRFAAERRITDPRSLTEHRLLARERAAIAAEVLHSLPSRDREILRRFYIQQQSAQAICGELGLTSTQFRLLKSRAKARLADKVSRQLNCRQA